MNREQIFKERFAAMLADMREDSAAPEDIAAVGGLADMVVTHAGQPTWSSFKATISKADYDGLLQSFQNQGNRLAGEGNGRQVHAIEVLAVSLIAKTQMRDAAIAADAITLDRLIDDALNLYRGTRPASPIIS